MAIKLEINGQVVTLNETQINQKGIKFTKKQGEDVITLLGQTIIEEKAILDICGKKFYVKDYQRGYRWTKQEVEALLNDINEVTMSDEKYCLQPLVIRKDKQQPRYENLLNENGMNQIKGIENELYEVIDGQQRLTTIRLILNHVSSDFIYNIYYEQFRKIDEKYLENANKSINDWFAEHKEIDKKVFFETMRDKLFFVWYEINEDDDKRASEEIFNNVNAGKIELTNAELFRALLLQENENDDWELKRDKERIALEWDQIEQRMGDDDFWYFISGNEQEETTRIDYILELYARNQNNEPNFYMNDRFAFDTAKKHLQKEAVSVIWDEIVNVYEQLYSWYCDDEIYHLLGFLIRCEEEKKRKCVSLTSNIVCELFKSLKDKKELKQELWEKAKETIFVDSKKDIAKHSNTKLEGIVDIETVNYMSHSPRIIRACLLFFNIWTCMQKSHHNRFSFSSYKKDKWDIEHINPKNLNEELPDDAEPAEYVEMFKQYAVALERDDATTDEKQLGKAIRDELNRSNPEPAKWKKCVRVIKDKDFNNDISNLTLLNARINRSYGNAFFSQKRNEIIKNDEEGTFIPPCTKNVFMKYYCDNDVDTVLWTQNNKDKYLEKMQECFDVLVRKGRKNEQ